MLKLKTCFLLSFILLFSAIQADTEESYTPWFTGPPISPIPVVPEPCNYYTQIYLFHQKSHFFFDNQWERESTPTLGSGSFIGYVAWGVVDRVGVEVFVELIRNSIHGHSSMHFGDLPAFINFQLFEPNDDSWLPTVKLAVGEVFPTGRFQKLNPKKLGADITGFGSYRTTGNLVFQKLYHIYGNHYLYARTSFIYTYFRPVHVRGINTYGGAGNTTGRVYPGSRFTGVLALEYNFTQQWGASTEIVYEHVNKTRFRGNPGLSSSVGGPSQENISYVATIEYSVSPNLGYNLGVWFAGQGRNSLKFNYIFWSLIYSS